jgi:hypothetical protein
MGSKVRKNSAKQVNDGDQGNEDEEENFALRGIH